VVDCDNNFFIAHLKIKTFCLKNTKNALLSEANKTFSEVYYYFLPKNLIGLQDARLDLHPYKNREMGVFN
jgi:hypothetical protein